MTRLRAAKRPLRSPSATFSALAQNLPLETSDVLNYSLKPWVALHALSGTRGTRHTFYGLARAIALSGALYDLGLEADETVVVKTGAVALHAVYRDAAAKQVWAIPLDVEPMLVRALEVYDRQLSSASRGQMQAALDFVDNRSVSRLEPKALKKAA
ncbi:hypothetical protein [Burkholderia sp. Ac-20365]|uniref:hypothetical protein n=1 Tax=Burkholderia sp. Ac-20365 TaxID=2703897 RepID=UPI00197B0C27|nr:hypothetical protein [Burkholderia sp. Ac-20365]MBN3761348.1 hypothetical protein [Burkholderia sp. Ac-20365]